MKGLREELQRLQRTHGQLTPQIVVTAARSEKSPLHMEFDWDDRVAAEQWRLEQAASLIKRQKVKFVDAAGEVQKVRQYVSMPNQDGPGRAYRPVEEVVLEPLSLKIIRGEMQRDWQALKRRYERFDEFARMVLGDPDLKQPSEAAAQ